MIKLVVSDVDGTLVNDGTCEINPEYFETIMGLKSLGIKVAIASGRQEDSIRRVFRPIEDELIYISNDGACISENNQVIFSDPMPVRYLPELVEKIKLLPGCDFALASRDKFVFFPDSSDTFMKYMRSYQFAAEHFKSYDELPPIYHVGIYHDPRSAHPALALVPEFKGRLDSCVSGHEWVDFTAPGVSKGVALNIVKEKYGIDETETVVFGDQANDVSMMNEAFYSFAVKGSVAAEKNFSKYLAPPMREDGVLSVMKEILSHKGDITWQRKACF